MNFLPETRSERLHHAMWLAAGRLREALRCEQHSEATLEAAVLDHVLGPKIRARQSTRKEQGYNRLSGLDGVRGRARAREVVPQKAL